MIFREAVPGDITQIQEVRNAVKENRLSDPALVTDEDCLHFMTKRGKGWVCAAENKILGFAIADLKGHNIWALFVRPETEQAGIGKALHQLMMDWYFTQTRDTVWLGTAPGTKAEAFYRKRGWTATGMHGKEIKFQMTYADWQKVRLL